MRRWALTDLLLDRWRQDHPAFADVLRDIHAQRHTGAVTIHFAQGHPNVIEFPCAPTKIRLDSGKRKSDT